MTFNSLEELERAAVLLREMSPYVKEQIRWLELKKEVGKVEMVKPIETEFLSRRQVRKLLRVGNFTIDKLIATGELPPLYVAGSNAMKFRREQVLAVPRGKQNGNEP